MTGLTYLLVLVNLVKVRIEHYNLDKVMGKVLIELYNLDKDTGSN